MTLDLRTDTGNIGLHLRNIYSDGELDESATAEESSAVRQEGRLPSVDEARGFMFLSEP